MGRFNYNFLATIKRQVYSGNPKKSSLSTIGTCYGFLSPVDQEANGVGIQTMGQAYQFQTDPENDIRAADTLTIDSKDYIVRGIRRYNLKRNDFIDCQLELPIKNT